MGNSISTSSARMAGMSNLVAEVGHDVHYEKSMGSSRFLKAIKASHSHGLIVVKTFIKPDPSMSLTHLAKRLRIEREALADVPNVLTYQKVIETERAGYLIRQWLASNLYDRISTRPFLINIEKKWITYQLLYAMRDARGRKIPHGDLKCENILVTSSLMVYVTDFAASFKPPFLPLDDPADFSFFFDTSGRRTCYVAPERFYEASSEIASRKVAAASAATTSLASGAPVDTLAPWNDSSLGALGLGKVTEAMDVFSMGCVIAELWRDGTPTFTLSQIFKYRQGAFDIDSVLTAEISDPHIRDMVISMISLDPKRRKTFDVYLLEAHDKAFPPSFYNFLHHYLVELQRSPVTTAKAEAAAQSSTNGATEAAAPPSASGTSVTGGLQGQDAVALNPARTESDERLERMYEEWSSIVQFFDDSGIHVDSSAKGLLSPTLGGPDQDDFASPPAFDRKSKKAADNVIPIELFIPGIADQTLSAPPEPLKEDDMALILLSVILANLRNCLRPSSKCHALDLLLHLSSKWLTDETKLDRVIPFVVSLLDDEAVQVRMAAIRTCTQLLMMVQIITPSNASIVPEYIIPNIKNLSYDPSTAVRCVFAACIVPLADTGERYLKMSQAMRDEGAVERDLSGDFMDNKPGESNYEAQLQILQGLMQEQITTLLTDPSASVKRALIANIEPLCGFFGLEKTNDVLLSHMITYLNDRNWLLREAFFETIVGVAKVTGGRSLEEYILPLMTQALSDTEEHVVARVLCGLASLAEDGLFEREKILGILSMTLGFLCHPNIWLREACAGLVAAAAGKLSQTDLWAVLYPSLRPLLKSDIANFSELTILDTVKDPISRPVFQAAVAWAAKASKTSFWKPPEGKDIAGLKNGLATEGVGHLLGKTGRDLQQTTIGRTEEDDANLDKLRAIGMEDEDQTKLVALRGYICRVARQTSSKQLQTSIDLDAPAAAEPTSQIRPAAEVQTLEGITPQTIFFSTNVSQPSSHAGAADNTSIPTGTFRSQNDGSFTGQVAKRRLAGERVSSEGSFLSPMQEIRRRMINDLSMRSAPGIAMPSTPGMADLGKPNALSPVLLGAGSPNPAQTQARIGVGKASAAVAPSPLIATGTMTDLATRLRNLDVGAPGSSNRTTPAGSVAPTLRAGAQGTPVIEGSSFSSTYDGDDPYIRAHLEAVYFKNFRDRPEFGPKVNSGPPRRRSARSALPTGPRSNSSSSNRRPEGNLIAYFTEHTAPITSVAVSPDHLFFVSGSEDGTLKVWDTARLEKNVTSRSRASYSAQNGGVTAVIAIEGSHCLASTSQDGSLHVWRVEVSQGSSIPRYAKPKLISNFQLSTPGEYATCLVQSTTETASHLILGTSQCRLTVLDLRTMQVLQTLRNPVEYGPITCLCVDKKKAWLLVGTLGGTVSLWDLRFGLLLRSWRVSTAPLGGAKPDSNGLFRVNKIAMHPSKGKGRWVLIASEGGVPTSTEPHVLVETWDVDKGVRVETFECGPFPKTEEERSSELVPATSSAIERLLLHPPPPVIEPPLAAKALYVSLEGYTSSPTAPGGWLDLSADPPHLSGYMLTTSTDHLIRFWDFGRTEKSISIPTSSKSEFRIFSNRHIHHLAPSSKDKLKSPLVANSGLGRDHKDAVTAIAVVEYPFRCLVAGDRTGCIRVWE